MTATGSVDECNWVQHYRYSRCTTVSMKRAKITFRELILLLGSGFIDRARDV